jgi:hypothetical protein
MINQVDEPTIQLTGASSQPIENSASRYSLPTLTFDPPDVSFFLSTAHRQPYGLASMIVSFPKVPRRAGSGA